MFKHILFPVDNSSASRKAIRKAIAFARETGARITAYHALPRLAGGVFGDGYRFPQPDNARAELRAAKAKFIQETARSARVEGVRFDAFVDRAMTPDEGILEAARKRKCDVIFMGTNGRRGLARLALGSVTSRVLTRSTVPVLVYR